MRKVAGTTGHLRLHTMLTNVNRHIVALSVPMSIHWEHIDLRTYTHFGCCFGCHTKWYVAGSSSFTQLQLTNQNDDVNITSLFCILSHVIKRVAFNCKLGCRAFFSFFLSSMCLCFGLCIRLQSKRADLKKISNCVTYKCCRSR